MDVILRPSALQYMATLLLSSSIWFDVTDGRTFLSHSDDGLHQAVIHDVARYLAAALSPAITEGHHLLPYHPPLFPPTSLSSPTSLPPADVLRVVRYHAIAMTLSDPDPHSSPLYIGTVPYRTAPYSTYAAGSARHQCTRSQYSGGRGICLITLGLLSVEVNGRL